MKNRISCLASFAVLAAGWLASAEDSTPAKPAAPATPSVTLPPEFDRVLREYESAWAAKDSKALAALFATDGFVLASGNDPVRGRDAIEAFYRTQGGPLALRAIAYASASDVGYILGAYAPEVAQPDAGKFTLTLRRVDEKWYIFSDMDNSSRKRS
jgi:ketosteroid isomerase-like protein